MLHVPVTPVLRWQTLSMVFWTEQDFLAKGRDADTLSA
ncbi:hypothetical protein JCM19238_4362 [Vibrio ponticus]|nr:hypothetical protein JCM19238_4362 [Vibrio ponticus]